MGTLRVYNSNPGSPLARCESQSAWEDRCVRYAEHVSKLDERDHEDERGYTWGSAKPFTEAQVAEAFGVPARFLSPEAQTEALRELLSYCRSEDERLKAAWEDKLAHGYSDVADRLAKILDGED
jgi:hypothetical protein